MTTESISSMGGVARAKSLTKEQRAEIAAKAAATRWGLPTATHKGELAIGDMRIGCYVLEDGRRLLSQRGSISALGMSQGTGSGAGDRLASFAAGKSISPFVSKQLSAMIQNPIKFMAGSPGAAHGYEATFLADICDAVLAARKAGVLQKQQLHIAEQCEILIRGFARVGIVALVDEATGYQEVRDRQALQAILDKYLRKEFAAWAKRFPDEFYQEIFRLRGWEWRGMRVNRPRCVATFTKDLVYHRLAPGIVEQLERVNPVNENGNRKAKHHQWLTSDVGHPALAQHIHTVIAFMRASHDWTGFVKMMDKALPKKGETLMLPMDLEPRTI